MMKLPPDERAIDTLVRRHGYTVHRALDDCDGCHRILALEFLQRLGLSDHDAPVIAEWVLSEAYLS